MSGFQQKTVRVCRTSEEIDTPFVSGYVLEHYLGIYGGLFSGDC